MIKKLTMLALAAAVAMGTPLLADDKAEDKPKAKRTNILAELGLDKDQRKKLNELGKGLREKQAELRKNKDLPKKDRAAKMKALNAERHEIMKKVLNEGQLKKYEEILAKRKAAGKEEASGQVGISRFIISSGPKGRFFCSFFTVTPSSLMTDLKKNEKPQYSTMCLDWNSGYARSCATGKAQATDQASATSGGSGGLQVRPGIIRRPQLDLTEDQQKQLQEIRQAYSESVRELFQNKDLTLEDRRDQAKDLRDDLNLQIEAVYTPEQKAKLAKYKDEQAKRLEEMRKNRPAVRPRIQLDEKQQKAMLKLRQEHAKKMQAARVAPS